MNQATSRRTARVSASTIAPRSSAPSGASPSSRIATSRTDEEDAEERERQRGEQQRSAASATQPAPVASDGSAQDDVGPLLDPALAVRRRSSPDPSSAARSAVRRVLREHVGQLRHVAFAPGRRTSSAGCPPGTRATSRKSMSSRAPARATSAPASTPANSTWRKQPSSTTPVGASAGWRIGEDDLGHRARRVRHDDRPVALARAAREATVVGLFPAVDDQDVVVAQRRPRSRARRTSPRPHRSGRSWRAGTRGRATRSPGSRRRACRRTPGRPGPRGRRRRGSPAVERGAVDVEADVAVVDRRDAVLRVERAGSGETASAAAGCVARRRCPPRARATGTCCRRRRARRRAASSRVRIAWLTIAPASPPSRTSTSTPCSASNASRTPSETANESWVISTDAASASPSGGCRRRAASADEGQARERRPTTADQRQPRLASIGVSRR